MFEITCVCSVLDQNSTASTYVEYVLLQKDHPCSRKCVEGNPPMICRYNFTIEWYQTMSKACYACPSDLDDCKRPDCITGDGRKRSIVVVNRQMPGPSIEVIRWHITQRDCLNYKLYLADDTTYSINMLLKLNAKTINDRNNDVFTVTQPTLSLYTNNVLSRRNTIISVCVHDPVSHYNCVNMCVWR